MFPSDIDRVPEGLENNEIVIGWSRAEGLLEKGLSWEDFREIVHRTYYAEETTRRRAGGAAGHLWRFINDMSEGDLVVVPYWSEFFVAEVAGQAVYRPDRVNEDDAHRRKVRWLNDGNPLPRTLARSALIARMKTQGTCAFAGDLLEEIEECIEVVNAPEKPSFQTDLQRSLVKVMIDQIRSGRIESFGFERFIAETMEHLGAESVNIIPRSQDKGADILANFRVAGAFTQRVAIQAKHWQPEPPVGQDVVEQLIQGIEAESADLGMVITSGSVSAEAQQAAEQYFNDKGIRIELIDGEQFAKLLIEHGVRPI